MSATWKMSGLLVLVIGLGIGLLATLNRPEPAFGGGEKGDRPNVTGPRYTIVETEGHNLVVTDNGTNTLYFYTVDKGEPIGSELKLRGQVDLNEVGKPSLTPKNVKLQK